MKNFVAMTSTTFSRFTIFLAVFTANLWADLDWSIELTEDSQSKLIFQSDPDTAYNLWYSEDLSTPFVHVDGFPKEGTGEAIEHTFNSGTKGFFRIDTAPKGFALIPGGGFEMGDPHNEGFDGESPVHTVFVSDFYMETTEVTLELWEKVREWGWVNGYHDLPRGEGKGPDHAAHSIYWRHAMQWCNARSEMEGLSPCYYSDDEKTEVGRKDYWVITHERVDWTANGYRLPTEAEWEKAARGGLRGKRFPWGDTISHEQANYYSDGSRHYDLSRKEGFHPDSNQRKSPFTLPVKSLPANNYGLYDMSGGVWEWCWDAYYDHYYSVSPAINPLGPEQVWRSKVMRGGAWTSTGPFGLRCSSRRRGWLRSTEDNNLDSNENQFGWRDLNDHGFRVVRGL